MSEAGIVENLVTQFSNALDCFRELVQNALDAGSPMVEVWCEFVRGEGHQGVIELHVDDFGEGMDERVIDEQLTQLFASAKEDDLTKIGKFGIGFVSVFALKPKAVLVHTGRGGEYWEVLFHEDRSFSKTRIDAPVEGTQITLYLEGDYHRYRELVDGALANLKHWCNHSEKDITFEDRSPPGGQWSAPVLVNEPFLVEGDCVTSVEHQGTQIVVAYHHEPSYGFYNRGLTLARTTIGENVLDRRTSRYRHVTFKMKSRYLEHTLSRETVLRDESYEKAMRLLDQAVDEVLLGKLLGEVEALVARERWTYQEVRRYVHLMSFLVQEPAASLEAAGERKLLRRLDGRAMTLAEAMRSWEEQGWLLVAEAPSALTEALLGGQTPIIYGRPPITQWREDLGVVAWLFVRYATLELGKQVRHQLGALLKATGVIDRTRDHGSLVRATITTPEAAYLPVRLDGAPEDDCAALVAGAHKLLRAAGLEYRKLTTCRLATPDEDPPLFVVARQLAPLMARPPEQTSEGLLETLARSMPGNMPGAERLLEFKERRRLSKRMEAAVNRDHPHLRALLRLHAVAPGMAAYCLAKDLLLVEDRQLDLDVALIQAAAPHTAA